MTTQYIKLPLPSMRFFITRKQHDFLMSEHNQLFLDLMAFAHKWSLEGIRFSDIDLHLAYSLKAKLESMPIETQKPFKL